MATDSLAQHSAALFAVAGLVCPVCRGALAAAPGVVSCVSCGRGYPVRDGLPVLIAAEASMP